LLFTRFTVQYFTNFIFKVKYLAITERAHACGQEHLFILLLFLQISEKAKSAEATPRLMELARAKPLADGFQHAREIEWPISKAAKKAQASKRVQELANPVERETMDTVQFNPDAFKVKPTALTGVIPGRVKDLYTVR
jgi:hypothetical protein